MKEQPVAALFLMEMLDVRQFVSQVVVKSARRIVEEEVSRHPLLSRVYRRTAKGGVVTVPAEVGGHGIFARYPVATMVQTLPLPPATENWTRDQAVTAAAAMVDSLAREMWKAVNAGIHAEKQELLGFGDYAPLKVGENTVGGISEATYPGWRSKALQSTYESMSADASRLYFRCVIGVDEPDLLALGTTAFRRFLGSFQRQQIFYVGEDRRLICYMGSFFYHEPQCDPHDILFLHTCDLEYHSDAPTLQWDPCGSPFTRVKSRHQLVAKRRMGFGRLRLRSSDEEML